MASKPIDQNQNGAASAVKEDTTTGFDEVESTQVEDKVEFSEAVEEDGWETINWDDVDLNDEEADFEPQPIVKEIKNVVPGATNENVFKPLASCEGVCLQARTECSLGALLLEFSKTQVNIPVGGTKLGPVHKEDVMKASVMLGKKPEYATILAFNVKVTPEARELADELGVKIFAADIINHLFDQFNAYIDNINGENKKEAADEAVVFPCVLQILKVFNRKLKDPILLGVSVLEGTLKIGTPICLLSKGSIDIGRIASIQNNCKFKPVDYAKKGQDVIIKIVGSNSEEQQQMFWRHFVIGDILVSHISRRSIDILKSYYRDNMTVEEWQLVSKLKMIMRL